MVSSDHGQNLVKLSKCAFYKCVPYLLCPESDLIHMVLTQSLILRRQADYSTHLLTYTFMNVGASAAFTAPS